MAVRTNKRSYAQVAGSVATGAYRAAKLLKTGHKVYAALKAPRRSGSGGTGTATTVQRDVKVMRKKRTNKKVLNKQKRFRSKIEKALQPAATHHTYTEIQAFAQTINRPAIGDPVQEQYVPLLNSEVFTLNAGTNNVSGITQVKDAFHSLLTQANLLTGAQKASTTDEKQIKVLKSSLELSLTNPSTIAMVYDIYWCVATNTDQGVGHSTPLATWTTILNQNTNFGTGPGPGLPIKTLQTHNGATPDSAPGFGKYWKILSKQRVYLQAGATSEFTFSGGGYNYNPSKFSGQSIVSGFTKGLLIVGGIGDNSGVTASGSVMRYHTTRKYRFMYPQGKDQLPNVPTNTTRFQA